MAAGSSFRHEDPRLAKLPIKVQKRESINQPPELVAEDRKSRVARAFWIRTRS